MLNKNFVDSSPSSANTGVSTLEDINQKILDLQQNNFPREVHFNNSNTKKNFKTQQDETFKYQIPEAQESDATIASNDPIDYPKIIKSLSGCNSKDRYNLSQRQYNWQTKNQVNDESFFEFDDIESGHYSEEQKQPLKNADVKLNKVLKAHNIAAITLGSVFGTGLLIRSAPTLQSCGPIPFLFSFAVISLLCYQVINALCEMCTYIPLPNAYYGYTERFVDPALGYAIGYLYLFQYLILGPNQVFVFSLTIQYWILASKVNPAVWITIILIVLFAFNYIDVSKIAVICDSFLVVKLTIYAFILCLLIAIVAGANQKKPIGFSNWVDPGVINSAEYSNISKDSNIIVSFISAIVNCIFPFVGIETFCVTVGEAYYPRRSIPKAKKIIFWLIVAVYFPLAFIMSLSVGFNDVKFKEVAKYNDQNSIASTAIIIAIENAGIQIVPHLLNAFMIIFIISSANSSFYFSSRILHSLLAAGLAPSIFCKTDKRGVPIYSIGLVFIIALTSYAGIKPETRYLYELFSNSVVGFGLILWACISLTHYLFLKACEVQNLNRSDSSYFAKGGKYASLASFVACSILCLIREFTVYFNLKKFDVKTFVTGYICIPVFFIIYAIFKLYYKTSFISSDKADLYFYKDTVDEYEDGAIIKEIEGYSKKRNPIQKFYKRVLV